MSDERTIISALYGDVHYVESIVRELDRAGIAARVLASDDLSKAEIPKWVSNGGAGATHYISVSDAQREDAAKVIAGLNHICQACGVYFSETLGHCPVCNEVWADRPAE